MVQCVVVPEATVRDRPNPAAIATPLRSSIIQAVGVIGGLFEAAEEVNAVCFAPLADNDADEAQLFLDRFVVMRSGPVSRR